MWKPDSSFVARFSSALLFGVGTLVAVASARMFWDGYHHLKKAESLIEVGDRELAMVEYESAAKAYVPGSQYTQHALRELSILAKGAEMRGELENAMHGWEVVRRSIIATRHFYQPNLDKLEVAEREIKRLKRPEAKSTPEGTDSLKRPDDPSPLASLLLFLGTLLWIGGSLALLTTSKQSKDTSSKTRMVFWIACLGGLALWIVMAWAAG